MNRIIYNFLRFIQSDSDPDAPMARGGVMRPTISSQNKINGGPGKSINFSFHNISFIFSNHNNYKFRQWFLSFFPNSNVVIFLSSTYSATMSFPIDVPIVKNIETIRMRVCLTVSVVISLVLNLNIISLSLNP